MAKAKKHRGIANPALAEAMRGKRMSSAAGTHADKRDKRARTRSANLARELRFAG
jgi:hypothetical protein